MKGYTEYALNVANMAIEGSTVLPKLPCLMIYMGKIPKQTQQLTVTIVLLQEIFTALGCWLLQNEGIISGSTGNRDQLQQLQMWIEFNLTPLLKEEPNHGILHNGQTGNGVTETYAQKSCAQASKSGPQAAVVDSGSRFEVFAGKLDDFENLVEVELLKETLESIPSPTTHHRPNPKTKPAGIAVVYKVRVVPNSKAQLTRVGEPREQAPTRRPLKEVQGHHISHVPVNSHQGPSKFGLKVNNPSSNSTVKTNKSKNKNSTPANAPVDLKS